jgi:tetratricopeptide (TPR) repeat protein
LLRAFFALMLLVPSVTFAEEDEEKPAGGEARKQFQEGNERYARGDYDGAVEAFKAAIAADPRLPGPYRNLGLAYRAQNKCTEALPMYEKYLQLKPESRFTERVRREIDLCRQKLGMEPLSHPQNSGTPHAPDAQSFLHVAANLIGGEATDEASVRIDGVMRGPTPMTVPITPGVHKIHLERPGFESADAVVEVGPGERREVELTMNKLQTAAQPVSEAERPNKRPSLRKLGWGLLGAAAAMGLLGAGLGIGESDLHQKAVAADPATTKRSQIDQWHSDGDNLAIGAWVGLSLGAAALTASVIVFILDGKRGETHEPQRYVIVPSISPGGGGIAASVRF